MASQSDPFLLDQQSPRIVAALKAYARVAAVLTIVIGGCGLLGWMLEIPVLKNVRLEPAMMKAPSALAFLFCGLSLWLRCVAQDSPRMRRFADACALAAISIGLLPLLPDALRQGFDREPLSPSTAVLFFSTGLALLLLDREDRHGRRPAQILLLLVGLFALALLIGHLFGILAPPRRGVPYAATMWPTALTFGLLAPGALCARPERGVMRVITADAVGGEVARRLLPAALFVPPLLCILCFLGYSARWYEVGFGLALLTVLNSAVITTLVWRTAGTLNQTAGQRQRAEEERNAANAALHSRVTELETLLDVLPVAVGIAEDPQCQRIRINPAFARLLALPTGVNASKSAPEEERPGSFRVYRNRRELAPEELPIQIAATQGVEVRDFEEEVVWNDGTTFHLLGYAAPLLDERKAVRGSVGAFVDITARKQLEDQLLQSQKLESVGRLAGGIAHDFNNLLTAILGYAELAEEELELNADGKAYLDNITQAAERASSLTLQLLAFARRQVIEPRVVNLNDLIFNLDMILQRLIGEHIRLLMQPAPDLHPVYVDPNQFEQILINLVVNARDAIPAKGGRIVVETSNVTLDAEYSRLHDAVIPGDYVMLAVSDTGSGMDEAVRLQIFEPFFTTKEMGRGTGLGLATVYGIVKQAGGHIWLYSEVGAGTTFRIYLPRAAAPTEAIVSSRPEISAPRGSETLLVVEDEVAVRALTSVMLNRLGYHVLTASDGAMALEMAAAYSGEIALLITDVVMPRMSGKELAEQLLAARPALKVLYVSGYTENAIVHHGALEPGINFLPKPFTSSALSLKVREALDASS